MPPAFWPGRMQDANVVLFVLLYCLSCLYCLYCCTVCSPTCLKPPALAECRMHWLLLGPRASCNSTSYGVACAVTQAAHSQLPQVAVVDSASSGVPVVDVGQLELHQHFPHNLAEGRRLQQGQKQGPQDTSSLGMTGRSLGKGHTHEQIGNGGQVLGARVQGIESDGGMCRCNVIEYRTVTGCLHGLGIARCPLSTSSTATQ